MAAKKKKKSPPKKGVKQIKAERKDVKSARKDITKINEQIKSLEGQLSQFKVGTEPYNKLSRSLAPQLSALREKLVSSQKNLSRQQTQLSGAIKNRGQILNKAGFEGLSNRLLDRAGNISNKASITGQDASLTSLINKYQPEGEFMSKVGGGMAGLLGILKDSQAAATGLGQNIVGMNLGEANTALLGNQDSAGMIDLFKQAARAAQGFQSQQQKQQALDIERLAPSIRRGLNALAPEVQDAIGSAERASNKADRVANVTTPMTRMALEQQNRLAQQAMNQAQNYVDPTKQITSGAVQGFGNIAALQQRTAEQAYANQGILTPEQQRNADQMARESFAARGMLGSTGSVAAEVLNRDAALQGRRAEAAGMGQLAQSGQQGLAGLASGVESDRLARLQNVRNQAIGLSQGAMSGQMATRNEAEQARQGLYSMGSGYYAGLGLPLTTQSTSAMGTGLGLLSGGMAMSGQGSGVLQAGTNVGLQNLSNFVNKENAYLAKNAQENAGTMGLFGNIIGGAANVGSAYFMGA